MAAMTLFQTEKCCHLLSVHAALATTCSLLAVPDPQYICKAEMVILRKFLAKL